MFNIMIIKEITIIIINDFTKFNIFIIYLKIDFNFILNINYEFRKYIYAKKNLSLLKNVNIKFILIN